MGYRMSEIRKSVASLLGGVSIWGVTAWTNDQAITGDEWFGLLAVVGTVLAVFGVKNEES